jgi:hypothetical protein
MIRRGIVAVVAWAMRRGIGGADMLTVLTRAFPHRDPAWRLDVIGDARTRNEPSQVDARLHADRGAARRVRPGP